MLNTVIISKDLNYAISLMNSIAPNSDIRVIGLLTEIEELEDIIKDSFIDIIMINMENFTYEILLENRIIHAYLKSIIIISPKNVKKRYNRLIYACVEDKNNFAEIYKILCQLSKTISIERDSEYIRKKIIIEKIRDELKYLKLKISYRGVRYLIESVYILYNLDNYYECNLEKDVYSILAKKYHKKISNIKSNINYTITILYAECEEDKLLEYLQEYSLCRLSPKKVIFSILNNVKKELEEVKV